MNLEKQTETETQETLQRKDTIKLWARELGFCAVGFTTAERDHELAMFFIDHARAGFSKPMKETQLERRVNPKAVWKDCQSIVVVAYPLPICAPPLADQGIFARSAVGPDYHQVISEKLNLLKEKIISSGWCSCSPNLQVDIGPLNERALAAKAGIGWIGKNQQLIVPKQGSFINLALLSLDQKLPPDQPVNNQCGDCKLCIVACPAGILGSRYFDSRQCISYLTQKKGTLSAPEASLIGMHIFGCDRCQEACPHNAQHSQLERNRMPGSADFQRGVDIDFLLDLSNEQFEEKFSHTAAGWRGKEILQRNAAVAFVNKLHLLNP